MCVQSLAATRVPMRNPHMLNHYYWRPLQAPTLLTQYASFSSVLLSFQSSSLYLGPALGGTVQLQSCTAAGVQWRHGEGAVQGYRREPYDHMGRPQCPCTAPRATHIERTTMRTCMDQGHKDTHAHTLTLSHPPQRR